MEGCFQWALVTTGLRNGAGVMLLFAMRAVALAGYDRRSEGVPISKAEFSYASSGMPSAPVPGGFVPCPGSTGEINFERGIVQDNEIPCDSPVGLSVGLTEPLSTPAPTTSIRHDHVGIDCEAVDADQTLSHSDRDDLSNRSDSRRAVWGPAVASFGMVRHITSRRTRQDPRYNKLRRIY
jgi:hypothetical protein